MKTRDRPMLDFPVLSLYNKFMRKEKNVNQESLDNSMLNYPLTVTIFTVIFAPIVEELVFRFTIFKPLAKKNKVVAYIISVLTFAGIHFFASLSVLLFELQDPLITNELAYQTFFDDLKSLPIYIVAALLLTISYDLNKNIATNIMIHSFYNLSQVFIMLLFIYLTKEEASFTSCFFNNINIDFIRNLLLI